MPLEDIQAIIARLIKIEVTQSSIEDKLKRIEKTMVRKEEFEPIKDMVNKAVWLIISGFVGAIISFVILTN